MSETKNEAFKRISKSRLEKIEKSISTLGNLASNNYDSSPNERIDLIQNLLLYTQRLAETFEVEIETFDQKGDNKKMNNDITKCEYCEQECDMHYSLICKEYIKNKTNTPSKTIKESPTVLKVVRDLEFGEMPLFASVLQEALLNFSKNKEGATAHLKQILRISAISLID